MPEPVQAEAELCQSPFFHLPVRPLLRERARGHSRQAAVAVSDQPEQVPFGIPVAARAVVKRASRQPRGRSEPALDPAAGDAVPRIMEAQALPVQASKGPMHFLLGCEGEDGGRGQEGAQPASPGGIAKGVGDRVP